MRKLHKALGLFALGFFLFLLAFVVLYLSLSQLFEQWNIHLIEDSSERAIAVAKNTFAYVGICGWFALIMFGIAAFGSGAEELA